MSESEFITAYVDYLYLQDRSEATVRNRRGTLRRVEARIGCPIEEATAAMLADWRAGLRVTPTTALNYITDVRQYCAWLIRAGLLTAAENPAASLIAPRKARRVPRPIADEDLSRAVVLADGHRCRPWLVLAAWCGLRPVEIAGLQRHCVLESAPRPAILIADGATKGHGERVVPMTDWVLAELRPYLHRTGYLFRRLRGRGAPSAHTIGRTANQHLREVGVNATIYQLRHWYGTRMHDVCRDLRVVGEVMGHNDPATTSGYVAYSEPAAWAAASALPVPPLLAA